VLDGEEVRSVIRTERSDNRNSHHVSDTQRLSA
jgi:hypothetical protein